MGLLKNKKLVKIDRKKNIKDIELNVNNKLNKAMKTLKKSLDFKFSFLDDYNNVISKSNELSSRLSDILDGKKINLKKQIKNRKILGEKINSIKDLDYYLYPKVNLTNEEKKNSSNIMIIGETGVGKSTWIHSLSNYLEGI